MVRQNPLELTRNFQGETRRATARGLIRRVGVVDSVRCLSSLSERMYVLCANFLTISVGPARNAVARFWNLFRVRGRESILRANQQQERKMAWRKSERFFSGNPAQPPSRGNPREPSQTRQGQQKCPTAYTVGHWYWWSRRELNPRPEALYRQFYMRSAVNWF